MTPTVVSGLFRLVIPEDERRGETNSVRLGGKEDFADKAKHGGALRAGEPGERLRRTRIAEGRTVRARRKRTVLLATQIRAVEKDADHIGIRTAFRRQIRHPDHQGREVSCDLLVGEKR